jgi:hypothetical protein
VDITGDSMDDFKNTAEYFKAFCDEGVDKRIDVFATLITYKAKVEDFFHLDLANAPYAKVRGYIQSLDPNRRNQ